MKFNDIAEIREMGFVGFHPIKDLVLNTKLIPSVRGVYLILHLGNEEPSYVAVGSGGHFNGKNPNVPIEVLKSNWVGDTIVVYIGKAGGAESKATLRSRLRQYLQFGQGKDIGHWGGRYIWQLSFAKELVVCWKTLPNENPRTIEGKMIIDFRTEYGDLPFANLVH